MSNCVSLKITSLEGDETWSVDSQENRCHQMSDFKAKMHQNRFPRPRCWSLQRSPDP